MSEPQPADGAFPRFSDWSFPAYRFVPGRSPHPERDPAGHAYGQCLPDLAQEARALERDWRVSPHFCFAIDCYNHAYWFEAHMYWEALWHCFPQGSAPRHALQMLVQVAAAQLVRFMDKPQAAQRLLKHAQRHLDGAGGPAATHFGLPLGAWFEREVVPFFAQPLHTPFPFLRPA